MDLPVPGLLMEGAVVAVWVTNKRSIAHFVRETLFPHWEIEYIAEWLWIKVCRTFDILFSKTNISHHPNSKIMCANGIYSFGFRFPTVRPRFKATLFSNYVYSFPTLLHLVQMLATCVHVAKLARYSS